MAIYPSIFTLTTAFILMMACSAYTQTVDVKTLFQSVDESISGVIIKGRTTTITPKDEYNKLAAMRRERTRVSQEQQKQRANGFLRRMAAKHVQKVLQDPSEIANIDTDKIATMMSVGRNFEDPEVMYPLAKEDVTHISDFDDRYVNGETLMYIEMYPDSAGGDARESSYWTNRLATINLYGATTNISITIPKNSQTNDKPGFYITKKVTPITKPTNNVIGARAFGRGLSHLSITGMEKSKDMDSANGDFYTVSVIGGFEFQTGKIVVDKKKDYCWTQKYFYNHDGLYTESRASDYRQVDGLWFPFHIETIHYLPENEWTDDNKIRRKSITEISSVEIDPHMKLSEETMLEGEIEIVDTIQRSSFDGTITTEYYMKPKQ